MRSGRLRHRVVIQEVDPTADSLGQPVPAWTEVATVWGSVEPLQGREFFAAQQVNADTTVRIRLRYRSGITPDMRISWDGRIYNILSIIDNREIHADLQLMCSEGVN